MAQSTTALVILAGGYAADASRIMLMHVQVKQGWGHNTLTHSL